MPDKFADRDNSGTLVLVSGATGFMGGAITRHLLDAGFSVRAMSRSAEAALPRMSRWPQVARALKEERLTFVSADVTQPETLPEAIAGVNAVVQAAQFPGAPIENPAKGYTYMNVDRGGTVNLLAALARIYGETTRAEKPRVIYLSGAGVEPPTPYPWVQAKLQAEDACRESGLPWCIVRSTWAYGPGDRSLNRLLGYTRYLPFLPFFGDGEARISPVFVEDVGRLFALVAAHPEKTEDRVLPLGGPQIVSTNQFLATALEVLGRKRPILHIPRSIGRAQGAVMQHLPGRPLTPDAIDFIAHGAVADLTVVLELFPSFTPLSIRRALAGYLREDGEAA